MPLQTNLKAIAWPMAGLFALTASLGIAARGIRHNAFDVPPSLFAALDNDVTVLAEHLLAGAGVPALLLLILLVPALPDSDKPPVVTDGTSGWLNRFFAGPAFVILSAALAVMGYGYHIMEHELAQMWEATGRGASAPVLIQHLDIAQILAGATGMGIFVHITRYTIKHATTHIAVTTRTPA
ncbi:MAG: hypothetical protein AWU57_491 [Marinobacter sp. T13-3]|nr:MAG: hypothetical protein AWU57_491 [Marinobacter sp. T13-3]